jgi:hypothetical protein
MADLVTTYTYTASGGTIIFNNGDLGDGTDKFWLQSIQGLDGPNVRAPVDLVPMGNGSLLHSFWLSGRTPVLEGVLIIESVPINSSACQTALNVMEDNLRAAVESNVSATATLAWTPTGQSAQSLTVKHNGQPRLDIVPVVNYALRQFVFGLIAATGSLA